MKVNIIARKLPENTEKNSLFAKDTEVTGGRTGA
jgi:hypothetical protein